MASAKISALTALLGANVAAADQLAIVDADAGVTKKITAEELAAAMASLGPTVWRNVPIPLFSGRRVTIQNPTTGTAVVSGSNIYEQIRGRGLDSLRSPAGLIADATPDATGQPAAAYGYDGSVENTLMPRLDVTAFKTWLGYPPGCVAGNGVLFNFQVPYDMAVVSDGGSGFLSTWRLQGRIATRGSGTTAQDYKIRMKMGAENGGPDGGATPPGVYNFGGSTGLQLADYTIPSGTGIGDLTNLDIDGSALQDSNGRCLLPGDVACLGVWTTPTIDASGTTPYPSIWWLTLRYLALLNPAAPS